MELKEFFINFSGLYSDFPTDFPGRFTIDLTSLDGTNCYCSQEAVDAVRTALSEVPAEALHWIDTGDYHYASLFFLEKIQTPYTLFLFDHHPDDQDSAFGTDILSCGNWVARARQLPDQSADFLIDRFPTSDYSTAGCPFIIGNIRQYAADGPQSDNANSSAGSTQLKATCLQSDATLQAGIDVSPAACGPQAGIACPQLQLTGLKSESVQQAGITGPQLQLASLQSEADGQQARTDDIQENSMCDRIMGGRPRAYLSIDKDVLSRDFARTNWDQGDMTLPELKDLIIRISKNYDIIGADVCGGLTESKGACAEDLKINFETDAELRELLLNLMIV